MMKRDENAKIFQVKVGFFGAKAVGKTAIIKRFFEGIFEETYNPTQTVNMHYYTPEICDMKLQLVIYDFPGDIAFRKVRIDFLEKNKMNINVVVVDAADSYSYFALTDILSELELTNQIGHGFLFLVLNKIDLDDIAISRNTMSALAQTVEKYYGIPPTPLIETSAKTGENIELLFNTIVQYAVMKIKTGSVSRTQI